MAIAFDTPSSSSAVERVQQPLRGGKPTVLGPIYKLNEDLLGCIIYLASSRDEDIIESYEGELMDTARYTAQVNRLWRYVALSHKLIWVGPALNWGAPYQWLDEVLRRSHPLPLDAIVEAAETRTGLVVIMLLKHVDRLRTLELEVLSRVWSSIVNSNQLQVEAPLLERFSVTVLDRFDSNDVGCLEQKNIFQGYAPMLRLFHAENCDIDIFQNPSMYSSLRHLMIRKTHNISNDQLLAALRQMKYLETLEFVRRSDSANYPFLYMTHIDHGAIPLLNLSELVIEAPVATCAQILGALAFPTGCSVRVHARNVEENGYAVDSLFACYRRILSTWNCESLTGRQTLDFTHEEIAFAVEGPPQDGLSNRHHPFVALTLSWIGHRSPIHAFFSLFPLVTDLFTHCSEPPDALHVFADIPPFYISHIQHLLKKCLIKQISLQAISFGSHQTFAAMEKLFQRSDDHAPLLPGLTDVAFNRVNFTTEKRKYWRRLLKILKFRDSVGIPILEIDFRGCQGQFRDQGLSHRFGTLVKVNGCDCSSDEDDDEGEASDYTVQALSD